MPDTLLEYQCTACGGRLHFDGATQMIICEYCGTKYPADYFEKQEAPDTQEVQPQRVNWMKEGVVQEQVMENQSGFTCSSCGAEIVSDGNTAATECMYCGSPVVISDQVSGMVKPDYVIPFVITKQEAEQSLKNFYKGKYLLPASFTRGNRVKKIAGLYVPFWFFSGNGDGKLAYEACIDHCYEDGDYDCVETQHFKVQREGKVGFSAIPADASAKMADDYMDGLEPYDYNALKDFSPAYMAGYFADKFDVSVQDCAPRAEERMRTSAKTVLESTVTGYTRKLKTQDTIAITTEDVRYGLLPVWMLNTKYGNKVYQFAINGQTGKVSGELPIDKAKQFLLTLGITAAAYLPLLLIVDTLLG